MEGITVELVLNLLEHLYRGPNLYGIFYPNPSEFNIKDYNKYVKRPIGFQQVYVSLVVGWAPIVVVCWGLGKWKKKKKGENEEKK